MITSNAITQPSAKTSAESNVAADVIAQHSSPLGTMWSVWNSRGLHRLSWDEPTCDPTASELVASDPKARSTIEAAVEIEAGIADLDQRLSDYFVNGTESFQNVKIDSRGWTDFSTAVYQCCRDVSAGTTISYKQLARLAGNEQASRAVGAAMSRNRILLVIPCHRVLAGSGHLRGFSALGGLSTKRQLLELERHRRWPADLFEN